MEPVSETILAGCPHERFVGREAELAELIRHFDQGKATGLRLIAPPRAGATELLLRTFDDLFARNVSIIPFYFKFREQVGPVNEARRFLYETILQFIAFRRRDPKLLFSLHSVSDLISIASPEDLARLAPSFKLLGLSGSENDAGLFDRCFVAPAEIMPSGYVPAVMLDTCDSTLANGSAKESLRLAVNDLSRTGVPFVFAERRRTQPPVRFFRRIVLEPLSLSSTARVIEQTATDEGVELEESVRDLLALRSQGDLALANGLVLEAADRGMALTSFKAANLLVQDSVYGGIVKRTFDSEFTKAHISRNAERELIGLMYRSISEKRGPESVDSWRSGMGLDEAEFERVANKLNVSEIVRHMSGTIEPMSENLLLSEYIGARYLLEVERRRRAVAFTRSLSELNAGSHELISASYKRASSLGLRKILERFDGQTVPSVLFDYGSYAEDLKGLEVSEISKRLASAEETLALPEVILAADLAAYYPQISELISDERAAVGVVYSSADTIASPWIAAEIDSKLEADADTAAFWCDRIEAAAAHSGLGDPVVWLIAPEGFGPEAMELLRERRAFGSSRAQVELLLKVLEGEAIMPKAERPDAEYEIIVPMGEGAEMIAAHTIEDIARRHAFSAASINKIKTALVEACINASEHSHSPDRRIRQHFAVHNDRITITIFNRGVRLTEVPEGDAEANGKRRGWGLQLMQKLMDEFALEEVDDGTKIVMTKYLDAE